MTRRETSGRRTGFTLIELLVVILIIGILISIVVPALGKFKRSARVQVTRGLLMQVVTAASAFQTDNRRIAGYYSAQDMGTVENGDGIGLSGMHNALLDLTGGPSFVGTKSPNVGSRALSPWSVTGPRSVATAWVNPSTMGVSSSATGAKAYFVPPAKHFLLPRLNRGTEIARFGTLDDAYATDDSKRMPDLVDAFGTPILWWGEDMTVTGPFAGPLNQTGKPEFAQIDSTKRAKFYWNTNAAYLKATSLGKNRADQTTASKVHSLIGDGVPNTEVAASMGGLLGNPSFADGLSGATNADQVIASGLRGKFMVHSADPDGIFLNSSSRGAKNVTNSGKAIVKFGYNFFLSDGVIRRLDDKGKPTSTDVLKDFEDLIHTGGS